MNQQEQESIQQQVEQIIRELVEVASIRAGQIVVIGTSTSEVVGQRIGTGGAEAIAAELYAGFEKVRSEVGFYLAFQCCEHLNRALVVERAAADAYRLDEVSAVPIAKAGGSMAAYAYRQLKEPCLVETIEAHAGIDIGETLIGMHLRRVAVPVRPSIKQVGQARVTMARTRPKLIGGERAVYTCN
ncbi:TIGR01440 family protein [Paenibacillus guangzhouensis]|uniref:TIGR01440 family protein n=1 Tax=Paenibacillus guangzhouensis TaxID=1473112 RepID=UPI0012673298|nr:TIGR01440 family protein [Paenibacillus guangzhouensis]